MLAKKHIFRIWWAIQLALQTLLFLGLFFVDLICNKLTISSASILIIILIINLLGFMLLHKNEQHLDSISKLKRSLYYINHYLQIIFYLILMPGFIEPIALSYTVPAHFNLIIIILIVLWVIGCIPVAIFTYGQVNSKLGRLLSLILTYLLAEPIQTNTHFPSIINGLISSSAITDLILIITIVFAMITWGYALPHFSKSNKPQILVLFFC